MQNLFLILFIIGLSFSCAKKDQTSQVDFRSTLAANASEFPGGLMLYGKNRNEDKHFARIITSDQLIEEIPNGSWDFYIIGWEGTTYLTGSTQCDVKKEINLFGTYTEIAFNMSNAHCTHPDFGPTFVSGGANYFFNYLSAPAGSGMASMNFGVKSFNSFQNKIDDIGALEYNSECFDITAVNTYSRSGSSLDFNYPQGSANSPFTLHQGFYFDAGCTGDSRGVLYKRGILGVSLDSALVNITSSSDNIFLNYPAYTNIPLGQ